jgi:fatty-acyl-CoA synthase
VLAFESAETDHAPLQRAVSAVIQKELSLRAHDIVVLPKGTLPKTSSGKLQRRKTREMYLQGTLGKSGSRAAGAKGSRMTVAKHVAQSVWSRAKAAATRR